MENLKNFNFLTDILTLNVLNDDKHEGKYSLNCNRDKNKVKSIESNKLLKSDKVKTEQTTEIMV
jgi:hypothetical protein